LASLYGPSRRTYEKAAPPSSTAFQQGTAQKREFKSPRTLQRDPLTPWMANKDASLYKSQPSILSEAFLAAFGPPRALVFVLVQLEKT
jgi:hypothetical protein